MKAIAGASCGLILVLGCRGGELPPLPGLLEGGAGAGGSRSSEHAGAAPAVDEGAEPSGGVAALAGGASSAGPESEGPLSPEECQAEVVSVAEITAGRVREGATVSVVELVATSQKFLVSAAQSGSCLWGAFAADPSRSGAGSGLFVVSFGAPRETAEAECPVSTDGIPADLAPGDVLAARGTLDGFVPAACEGVAPALQLRVDASCPLSRSARGAPPEPAELDLALSARLAQGDDTALLREWGGALVRLSGVSALPDAEDGDAVQPFGAIRLAETPLEVRSRLYYFDLTGAGPRDSSKSPRYPYPTAFSELTGIVFLDYCTWALSPRDRCRDASPPSSGCD